MSDSAMSMHEQARKRLMAEALAEGPCPVCGKDRWEPPKPIDRCTCHSALRVAARLVAVEERCAGAPHTSVSQNK